MSRSHTKPAQPNKQPSPPIQRPHDTHDPNAEVDVDDAQIEEPKDEAFEGGKEELRNGERGKNGKA